jgi:hypothetical protein
MLTRTQRQIAAFSPLCIDAGADEEARRGWGNDKGRCSMSPRSTGRLTWSRGLSMPARIRKPEMTTGNHHERQARDW